MSPAWQGAPAGGPASTSYRVLDERRGVPELTVEAPVPAERIAELVDRGYLHLDGVLTATEAASLAAIVDRLADLELDELGARRLRGNGYYVRDLAFKDPAFAALVTWRPMLALARTLLGPQVRVRVDARVTFAGEAGAGVPWHIHLPAVPDPLPPFWSHPHSVAVLLYLDDVDEAEGALVLAPGTHHDLTLRADEVEGRGPTVDLLPRAGDAVVTHGNLWHRTRPTTADARRRRVLFLGATAAWVVDDVDAAGQPDPELLAPHLSEPHLGVDEPEARELLGRFRW